jgi:3',5'-cyclic AMP phosphodiesterase CpdA
MKRRFFLASTSSLIVPILAREDSSDWSFGVITDIQYADVDPEGERHYRSSLNKLDAIVAHLRSQNLSFTLHLGDLIDRSAASFAPVLKVLDRLPHPCHHLLGNHDYSLEESEKCHVTSRLRMPHDYYVLYRPGWRIFMLDTNAISTYKNPALSPETQQATAFLEKARQQQLANAVPWGGACGKTQMAWLTRELNAAQAQGDKVILCGHHPLLPADPHQLWDSTEMLALLRPFSCVKAWFNGHNHAGSYVIHEGIHCVTFCSVLHEPKVHAAAVITLFADHMLIQGFGREPSRQLMFR